MTPPDEDKKQIGGPKAKLPSLKVQEAKGAILGYLSSQNRGGEGKLPPGALVYAIGAAVLVVMAFYHLLMGAWFTSFLILAVAIGLFGFALYALRFSGS